MVAMFKGSLLAMDVGGGTQDIFIWEPGQTVENGVKLVLPAPTQVMARRVRRLTNQGQPIFLTGRVMGGGPPSMGVGASFAAMGAGAARLGLEPLQILRGGIPHLAY